MTSHRLFFIGHNKHCRSGRCRLFNERRCHSRRSPLFLKGTHLKVCFQDREKAYSRFVLQRIALQRNQRTCLPVSFLFMTISNF